MWSRFRTLLFLLPAEFIHRVAIFVLGFVSRRPSWCEKLARKYTVDDPSLEVRVMDRTFPNPLGLAAGFDKDAEVFEAMHALGFGFVEVGTLTWHPQPGNPKPRLFRLKRDAALINRLGFNNHGAQRAATRLSKTRSVMLGVNIGKSKIVSEEETLNDYLQSATALAPYADYLVINVSSPNTPGLRDWQTPERLAPLIDALSQVCAGTPLLVKMAPDLSDEMIVDIAGLALELNLSGLILTNTTISREGLASDPNLVSRCGAGGLSGRPLKQRSLEVLRMVRRIVGPRMCLISVGGIEHGDDVYKRLRAGASLVQLYTALVYRGPTLPRIILEQLLDRMQDDGFTSIGQFIGCDVGSDRASSLRMFER